MKFGSIYLKNYIGIYNGMGLKEISIDFTAARNRIIIIRGDNGSGKSTIMKALSIFPDGNESFIPDEPAMKIITLMDGPTSYRFTFIHGVKNGQRQTTKAYIAKTTPTGVVELNENGNVTSYKSILFDELGLDPNFESLSQLSTDDRGIADKKPADRKRFVNSILSNMDVYNDIYKSLTKRASNFKNLISSITAKLNSVGDPNAIAASLEAVEERINIAQDQKDAAVEALAKATAKMEVLDPDGSISATIDKLSSQHDSLIKSQADISAKITSARMSINMTPTNDAKGILDAINDKINAINIDNQLKRGEIETLLKEQERYAADVSSRIQKMQAYNDDDRFEEVLDEIASLEAEKEEIEKKFAALKIDPSTLSKEGFIAALDYINRVVEEASTLKSECDYMRLMYIIEDYKNTGEIPTVDADERARIAKKIADEEFCMASYEKEILELQADIKTLDVLQQRPKLCKIGSCPFIREALKVEERDPKSRLNTVIVCRNLAEKNIGIYKDKLAILDDKALACTKFANFIRDIQRGIGLVSKLPCAKAFSDLPTLVGDIFNMDYLKDLGEIYSYIDYANDLDVYNAILVNLNKLYSDRDRYGYRKEIVEDLQRDIDAINRELDAIAARIVPLQSTLASNDKALITLKNRAIGCQTIIDLEKELTRIRSELEANNKLYDDNREKIKTIKSATTAAQKQVVIIENLNKQIEPLMRDRDRLNHQMRMVDDYTRELDMLNNQYSRLETIRYYSSPTTGIQLVFMEMYMGKVIDVANSLLSMFFNGKFRILSFIINESEFRIPCAGDGLINDDISSMSSAQIAMISMILSFSFLYNSSTKYNILKLDEIDGPLDGNNRLMFTDVLNNVMNMMGTEQCIMISHNSELQTADADIILLKSSDDNGYNYGNIIWRY